MPATSSVADLVRTALDEFDDCQLDATVRRVTRIASLLGESQAAVRFSLDLKPIGGHPPSNAEDTRRVMVDPSLWADPKGPVEEAMTSYCEDRKRDDGLILGHSISELEFLLAQMEDVYRGGSAPNDAITDITLIRQILTQIRHRAFSILCFWERRLTFSNLNEDMFRRYQARVDHLLASGAPELIDRFNAVYRRLHERAGEHPDELVTEELSQAVTTCRRILKKVVDHVRPAAADDQIPDDQYRTRLRDFLREVVVSTSGRNVLTAEIEGLASRFNSLDKLANKGVHADLAIEEAEFCAINTYIVTGEILRLSS